MTRNLPKLTSAAGVEGLNVRHWAEGIAVGMLSAVPDALVVVDADETIVFVNEGAEALFGWPAIELIGQRIRVLVPAHLADLHDQHCARYRAHPTRRPMGAGLRLSARRRDGTEFLAEISLSSFDAGSGLFVLVAIRDMTLAERWDLFERFANTTEIGLAVTDSRTALYSNPSFAALVGTDGDSPSTLANFIAMVHPADRAKAEASVEASRRGDSNSVELRMVNGTDETRWFRVTNEPFRAGDDRVPRIGTAVTDITDLKLAEQDAQAARDEAERANAAKDDFLSRMSHELRTPLNAVLGFAQLLALDPLGAQQQDSVDHIIAAGQHLLGLIDEVLDTARVSSGGLRLAIEPVRLADVVAESIGMIRPLADRRNIRLVSGDVASDVHVAADRQRLGQVVLNLLANAVKYNRDGGEVVIASAVTDDGRIRLTIADTGIGIATDDVERIFQPFERLNADDLGVEGSGLGLGLARLLMTAMSGEIGLTSQIDQGTSFWIEFPIAAPLLGAAENAENAEPVVGADAGSTMFGRRRTVLYVEDNPSNVRLLERLVATVPGVDLIVAGKGLDALEIAFERSPDLVLLDLRLPDISGEQVLRVLRADPRSRTTPVVMLSADASPRITERLIEAGATEFITKPFDVQRLLALIDRLPVVPPG